MHVAAPDTSGAATPKHARVVLQQILYAFQLQYSLHAHYHQNHRSEPPMTNPRISAAWPQMLARICLDPAVLVGCPHMITAGAMQHTDVNYVGQLHLKGGVLPARGGWRRWASWGPSGTLTLATATGLEALI